MTLTSESDEKNSWCSSERREIRESRIEKCNNAIKYIRKEACDGRTLADWLFGHIYLRFYDTKQHHKPHVHVKYNEDEAVVALDGELLSGELPVKQRRILDGWMALHEEEAYAAWNLAVQGKQFEKIVPAM